MLAHPEIDIVSRDRGGDYAAAARKGAPQARQIADRFPLAQNLTDRIEVILARCRAEIRRPLNQETHRPGRTNPRETSSDRHKPSTNGGLLKTAGEKRP